MGEVDNDGLMNITSEKELFEGIRAIVLLEQKQVLQKKPSLYVE